MKQTFTLLLFWMAIQPCMAQWKMLPQSITASFINSAVAYDGKVYFTGGSLTQFVTVSPYNAKVHVLDLETETITELPQGLSFGRAGIMCAALDGKIYFAGGFRWTADFNVIQAFATVDIYDVASGNWSTAQLSQNRGLGSVAVFDGKIMFAGGWTSTANGTFPSKVVDIFDPQLNGGTWTTSQLSQARGECQAAAIGSKVWVCGGMKSWITTESSNRVDVYDNGTWTTDTLSMPRQLAAVVAVKNFLICAGGYSNTAGWSNVVDIYNNDTGMWTTHTLQSPRMGIGGAVLGNKAYFTGGGHVNSSSYFNITSKSVDVFDADEVSWSNGPQLNHARMTHGCAAWGNKIAVGGGWRAENPAMTLGSVEVFTDTTLILSGTDFRKAEPEFSLFPNPAGSYINIYMKRFAGKEVDIVVYNAVGHAVYRQHIEKVSDHILPLSLEGDRFQNGIYLVSLICQGERVTQRLVIAR